MTPPPEILQFGPFLLDRRGVRLLRDGVEVDLTPRAYALLDLLAGSPGKVFRRESLMDAIWGEGAEVSEGALSQLVLVLRRALGPEGHGLIRTVAKTGYAFEGVVSHLADDRADVAGRTAIPGADEPTADLQSALGTAYRTSTRSSRRGWLALLGLLLIGALALEAVRRASTPERAAPLRLTIAGVDATGPQSEQAWAADALNELLAAVMRGQSGIAMRAPADAEAEFADSSVAVLRGAIAASEGGVLTIHWHLLGGGYDSSWEDALASDRLFDALPNLRDALKARTQGSIELELPASTLSDATLLDYTVGIQSLAEGKLVDARAALERAVSAAPGFALAQHALARTTLRLGYRDLALSHAREALAALDPGSDSYPLVAHQMLTVLNRHDEAAAQAQRLVARQPEEVEWRLLLATSQVAAGNLDAARQALAALNPVRLSPRWRGRWLGQRMRIAIAAGEFDEAKQLSEELEAEAARNGFSDLSAEALMARADVLARQGGFADAYTVRAEAIAWYQRSGAAHEALRARALQLGSAAWAGVQPELSEYEAVRDQARQLGNPEIEAGIELALANRAVAAYDFAAQRSHLMASRELLLRLGAHPWLPTNAAALSENDGRIGSLEETWQRLVEAETMADGRVSERWRMSRARAIVRRLLGDMPGAIEWTRRAASEARADGIAGHEMLDCEVLALEAQTLRGEAAAGPLRDCALSLAGASQDQDRAWRIALEAVLAMQEARAGRIEQAIERTREADRTAHLLTESERMEALLALAPAYAAVLPPAEADAALLHVLDQNWARTALRQRAELLVLRCLAGRSGRATELCEEARRTAPTTEGQLGRLLALAELPRAEPDDIAGAEAAEWVESVRRLDNAVLLQLGVRAERVPRTAASFQAPPTRRRSEL
jgi:DNA-binding winged helix-turn-helix (wHTH) protein